MDKLEISRKSYLCAFYLWPTKESEMYSRAHNHWHYCWRGIFVRSLQKLVLIIQSFEKHLFAESFLWRLLSCIVQIHQWILLITSTPHHTLVSSFIPTNHWTKPCIIWSRVVECDIIILTILTYSTPAAVINIINLGLHFSMAWYHCTGDWHGS